MNKSSRIYVAGHRGLVGSAICRRLEAEGFTDLLIRRSDELDLTRQAEVEAFFQREKPDYVFLAAAKVGGILANNTYPADFIYKNIMIQSNIIHASYTKGVRKLLFLGSSCIYPKFAPQPMKEEYLLTGELEPTNEPYAVAKIAGIKMCQAYDRQYGTNYISIMPTNLYGPFDNFDLETSHVLPALIRKFHEGKEKYKVKVKVKVEEEFSQPEPIPGLGPQPQPVLDPQPGLGSVVIWGTGTPKREFLHIDDLADACVFLMKNYDRPETVNIGVGEDISISDLAVLIGKITGYKGDIVYDSSKPDGTPKKLLDVSRLRGLGWKSKISLEEGITRTYEWYVKERE